MNYVVYRGETEPEDKACIWIHHKIPHDGTSPLIAQVYINGEWVDATEEFSTTPYIKPINGIPEKDLEQNVKDKLNNIATEDNNGLMSAIDKIKLDNLNIYYGDTDYWEEQAGYVPKSGEIIIYSDYSEDSPGIKIGNNEDTVENLPFFKSFKDIDTTKLLNTKPIFRAYEKDANNHIGYRYKVYHPLQDYPGAEIVLLHYCKRNGKKRSARYTSNNFRRRDYKKGWSIAYGERNSKTSHPYFEFSNNPTQESLSDYIENYNIGIHRHFGIALRIPNPNYKGPSTSLKNAIYKGVPESLWSDVLPIKITRGRKNGSGYLFGIGLL